MPGLDASSAITIGGVECWDEGTREVIDQYNTSASRVLRCRWADRFKLVNVISPGATQIGGLYVFNAKAYPAMPSLYPQRFTIEGQGVMHADENDLIGYEQAVVTVEYTTFRGGDPQGYTELEFGANWLTLSRNFRTLKVTPSVGGAAVPLPPADANAYPLVVIGFTRGMRNVAGLANSIIKAAAKAPINSKSFMGYDEGTVIFLGGRAFRQTASNSGTGIGEDSGSSLPDFDPSDDGESSYSGVWDVEFKFQARPGLPWDHLPYPDSSDPSKMGGFGLAQFDNGDDYIGRSDLSRLFKRGASFTALT